MSDARKKPQKFPKKPILSDNLHDLARLDCKLYYFPK